MVQAGDDAIVSARGVNILMSRRIHEEVTLRRLVGIVSHPAATTWLALLAVVIAGVGQWLLGQPESSRGWLVYAAAIGILAPVLVATRPEPARSDGSTHFWPPSRGLLLTVAVIGQAVAVLGTRTQHSFWPVFLPWAGSLVAVAACLVPLPAWMGQWRLAPRALEWLAIGAVIVVAAILRFVNLEAVPSGIHGDEGEFGAVALAVVRGQGPSPFGVAFLDDPALYMFLLAPFVALFGVDMSAIRLLSAFVGTATVGLLYLFGRELFGVRTGLIAALLLAGSAVHIHFSRTALNVIEAPFFACLSLWLLWKALTTERALWYVLSGLAGGLGFYFHFSTRMVAPMLAIVLLWRFVARLSSLPQTARALLLTGSGGLLALTPFLSHTASQPSQLSDHVSGRMIWNHWTSTAQRYNVPTTDPIGVIGGQIQSSLAALIQRPDIDVFFSFAGLPMVNVAVAPLVLLGLAAVALRPRTPRYALIGIWFVTAVIFGSVLIINAGAFHRMLIALLPAFIAGAALIDRLLDQIRRAVPAHIGAAIGGVLVLVAPAAMLLEAQRYFGPAVGAYPWAVATAQARHLQSLAPGSLALVAGMPFIYASHGPSRYLGHAIERRDLHNPTVDLPARTGGRPLSILINPAHRAWVALFRAYYPQAEFQEVKWPNGQTVLLTLTVPPAVQAVAQTPAGGLRGEIRPLAGGQPVQTRVDPAIIFNELSAVARSQEYEAQWVGTLRALQTGEHELEVISDGAIELLLDQQVLLADSGMPSGPRALRQRVRLDGNEHPVQLRGSWRGGSGYLALYWRPPGGERELVPPQALRPGS